MLMEFTRSMRPPFQKREYTLVYPMYASGILYLIHSIEPDITGLEAVVIGRSAIVGMPTAQLLCRNNATVTICHSKTVVYQDLQARGYRNCSCRSTKYGKRQLD
jgi:5,10-methylene-tetrahydrofolate dehydrogenase/methenyl tetrahydrofolate cyclohydrolase